MDIIQNEKILCRILQGRLRYSSGGPALYIYEPTSEILEESFEVYDECYNESYFKGAYLKSELVEVLVGNNLWSPFDDREAEKIEKKIEEYKLKAFEFFYKIRDLESIKMVLRHLEKELIKYKNKKHVLDHVSCEGVADFARSSWIISKTVYNSDKTLYDWSNHSTSSIMDYYNSNKISSDQFRHVARNDPWRSMWNVGKKQSSVFEKPSSQLTKDQIALCSYSSMYDNVYESQESPDERVIEDDDCLDGWFIHQRKEYEKKKKQKTTDDMIKNPKIANSQEIFLMANDQEEANKIFDINHPSVRGIIKDRQQTIKSADHQIKFTEFNDVKQDIAIQGMQAAKSKIKGMR